MLHIGGAVYRALIQDDNVQNLFAMRHATAIINFVVLLYWQIFDQALGIAKRLAEGDKALTGPLLGGNYNALQSYRVVRPAASGEFITTLQDLTILF